MDDSEAQERISALFGLIKGINPHDEKLTNQEKLEEIFGGRDEKLEAIEKEIGLINDELEVFEEDEEDKKFVEGLKLEWKVLYHIREILEK